MEKTPLNPLKGTWTLKYPDAKSPLQGNVAVAEVFALLSSISCLVCGNY
jgi:hypothetical protein